MGNPAFVASRLLGGGEIMPARDWRLARHAHRFHELIIVLDGVIHVFGEEGEEFSAEAGQAMIYPAHVAHAENSDPHQPVHTLFFAFEGETVDALTVFTGVEDRLATLGRFLLREHTTLHHAPNLAKLQAYLELIAHELIDATHPPKRVSLVAQADHFMAAHYHQKIMLSDLANACHMSPFHFSRLYKTHTGFSPMQSLKRFRLQRAKALLRTTSLTLAAIAEHTGFANEYHLSREFKRYEAQTIADFRNKAAEAFDAI